MIELLIVIILIGLLSVVAMNAINARRQQEFAQEASLRANLGKTCAALGAYYQGENETLPAEGANNNPLEAGAGNEDLAAVYLSSWFDGLQYNIGLDGTTFGVHIQRTLNTEFFKCNNVWGEIRECADTTDNSDPLDCD